MLQPDASGPSGEDGGASRAVRPEMPRPELDPAWRAGRKLREARRQLGLSIEEVAERIRVRREFLEALEEMNVKVLPGKAYAVAFLRSYARELDIDEKAIVEQFQEECVLTREDPLRQVRNPSSRPKRAYPWAAAVVLLAVAVSLVVWRQLQTASGPVIDRAIAGDQIASAASSAGTEDRRVVEIRAVTEAWLEARGPDGTVFLDQVLRPGDVYRPDPSPGWTLHARDGAAFELFVNGQPAGPLGAAGMPVLGRSIDEIAPLAQPGLVQPRS